ncbi:hypothetical protein KIPB_013016, partial [Kipferlia bialata]
GTVKPETSGPIKPKTISFRKAAEQKEDLDMGSDGEEATSELAFEDFSDDDEDVEMIEGAAKFASRPVEVKAEEDEQRDVVRLTRRRPGPEGDDADAHKRVRPASSVSDTNRKWLQDKVRDFIRYQCDEFLPEDRFPEVVELVGAPLYAQAVTRADVQMEVRNALRLLCEVQGDGWALKLDV